MKGNKTISIPGPAPGICKRIRLVRLELVQLEAVFVVFCLRMFWDFCFMFMIVL